MSNAEIAVIACCIALMATFLVGTAAARAWDHFRDRFRPRF